MTGLIVDNVSLNDDVIIMIVAKTGAETTPPLFLCEQIQNIRY